MAEAFAALRGWLPPRGGLPLELQVGSSPPPFGPVAGAANCRRRRTFD